MKFFTIPNARYEKIGRIKFANINQRINRRCASSPDNSARNIYAACEIAARELKKKWEGRGNIIIYIILIAVYTFPVKTFQKKMQNFSKKSLQVKKKQYLCALKLKTHPKMR